METITYTIGKGKKAVQIPNQLKVSFLTECGIMFKRLQIQEIDARVSNPDCTAYKNTVIINASSRNGKKIMRIAIHDTKIVIIVKICSRGNLNYGRRIIFDNVTVSNNIQLPTAEELSAVVKIYTLLKGVI